MTDEEYKKYFLKNEYYDILTTEDALLDNTEFWLEVLTELDKILDKQK